MFGPVGPGGPAEFRADGHQRLVQQPALFEVFKRPAIARSTAQGLGPMVSHVAVRVPVVIRARVDQLDDAHAALDQPPGDQALVAKRGRVAFVDSV